LLISSGYILVIEYVYLLMQNKQGLTFNDALSISLQEYKTSGTQTSVETALKGALRNHGDGIIKLCDAVIDIIMENRMCKSESC
jgi:hypothetical protein